MAAGGAKCQGKEMSEKDKAERLAAKLRENLRKRKAQGREMEGNVLRDATSTSSVAPQDERS